MQIVLVSLQKLWRESKLDKRLKRLWFDRGRKFFDHAPTCPDDLLELFNGVLSLLLIVLARLESQSNTWYVSQSKDLE